MELVRPPYRQLRVVRLAVALVLALVATGCGDQKGFVQVSGKVTIDNEPLTNGIVRFFPVGGRQSGGELDANGNFTLSTYSKGDGIAKGSYSVAVIAREPLSGNKFRWHAPKQYANPATSKLREEIDGPKELTIELTWGDQKGPFVERM